VRRCSNRNLRTIRTTNETLSRMADSLFGSEWDVDSTTYDFPSRSVKIVDDPHAHSVGPIGRRGLWAVEAVDEYGWVVCCGDCWGVGGDVESGMWFEDPGLFFE
jgi:hypothetical protein